MTSTTTASANERFSQLPKGFSTAATSELTKPVQNVFTAIRIQYGSSICTSYDVDAAYNAMMASKSCQSRHNSTMSYHTVTTISTTIVLAAEQIIRMSKS